MIAIVATCQQQQHPDSTLKTLSVHDASLNRVFLPLSRAHTTGPTERASASSLAVLAQAHGGARGGDAPLHLLPPGQPWVTPLAALAGLPSLFAKPSKP